MYNLRVITFILPGYSAKNKDWAMEIAEKIKLDHEIRPVFWEHWENPQKNLRPKIAAQDIIDILKGGRANIIAKSVGTLVALYVVSEIPDKIEKMVLCGIPSVSENRLKIFRESIKDFPPEKIVVFQNSKDPLGNFSEVRLFMQKINPKIKVIEMPRSDHNYPYPTEFEKFLS